MYNIKKSEDVLKLEKLLARKGYIPIFFKNIENNEKSKKESVKPLFSYSKCNLKYLQK